MLKRNSHCSFLLMQIDPEKETNRIVKFVKTTLKQQGFQKVIIALSGGVDSSATLNLALKAIGKDNVLVAVLPYGKQSKQDVKDALMVADLFKISPQNLFKIDIKPIVDSFLMVAQDATELRKGNIITRVRMILLFDLARKHQALVCGTENRSEYLLGYYTRFGDEASDLEPIRILYKTQVKALAKYLKIPVRIINKFPSAGLWQNQTDEKELGFSYSQADPILHLHFDKGHSWGEISQMGFKKRLVEKVRQRVEKNEFKKKVPYLPKI